jgi:hypothetical protein
MECNVHNHMNYTEKIIGAQIKIQILLFYYFELRQ